MTVSSLDTAKISEATADLVRVRMDWQRMDLSHDDQIAIRNFVFETLSKYVDDSKIQRTQLNPKTGEPEDI